MAQPIDDNSPYAWFEEIYADGMKGGSKPPWAGMEPSRWLTRWDSDIIQNGSGRSALVIGCGMGDDAEWLAEQGFDTIAFDVAPSAIEWSKQRFPNTTVDYQVVDMFNPPIEWLGAFDFVFESRTIQALPPETNPASVAAVSRFVAPSGDLLIVCLGKPKVIEIQGPPWPLTRDVVDLFQTHGLVELSFEAFNTDQHTPVRRWRIHYKNHAR